MFILFDPRTKEIVQKQEFINIFKTKWNEIHNISDIFRYKINNVPEKIVNNKYLLQLNPERSQNRRAPEQIDNICQPFNKSKFNFTKVSPEEMMFAFREEQEDDNHAVIVNVSPIIKYHALLCPAIDKCLPQVVTKDSLKLVIDIMLVASDRNLRIGFNSLCALASVNHLHYHLCLLRQTLPVEKLKCEHIKGTLHRLDKLYPAPAFCFQISKVSVNLYEDIYKLVEHFVQQSIAHNIFVTWGDSFDGRHDAIRVIIWPRKSSSGVKQYDAFNVAVFELSGWFPVYNTKHFENLKETDLEAELCKWKYDDFEDLCETLKLLY